MATVVVPEGIPSPFSQAYSVFSELLFPFLQLQNWLHKATHPV